MSIGVSAAQRRPFFWGLRTFTVRRWGMSRVYSDLCVGGRRGWCTGPGRAPQSGGIGHPAAPSPGQPGSEAAVCPGRRGASSRRVQEGVLVPCAGVCPLFLLAPGGDPATVQTASGSDTILPSGRRSAWGCPALNTAPVPRARGGAERRVTGHSREASKSR